MSDDEQTSKPEADNSEPPQKVVSLRGRRPIRMQDLSDDPTPVEPPEPDIDLRTNLEKARDIVAAVQGEIDEKFGLKATFARLDAEDAEERQRRERRMLQMQAIAKAQQAGLHTDYQRRINDDYDYAKAYLEQESDEPPERLIVQSTAPNFAQSDSGAVAATPDSDAWAGDSPEAIAAAAATHDQDAGIGEAPALIIARAIDECRRIDLDLGENPDSVEAMMAEAKKRIIMRTATDAARKVGELNQYDQVLAREMQSYNQPKKGGSLSFLGALAQGLLGGNARAHRVANEMKDIVDRRRQAIEKMDIERRWLTTAADRVIERHRDARASFEGAASILSEACRVFGDTEIGRGLAASVTIAAQQAEVPVEQLVRQISGHEPVSPGNRQVVDQLRTQYGEAMEQAGDDATEALSASALAREQLARGQSAIEDAINGLEMLAKNSPDIEGLDRGKLADWFGDTTQPLDGAMDVTNPAAIAAERERLNAQIAERIQAIFEMIDRVLRAVVNRIGAGRHGVEAAAAAEAEPAPSC